MNQQGAHEIGHLIEVKILKRNCETNKEELGKTVIMQLPSEDYNEGKIKYNKNS